MYTQSGCHGDRVGPLSWIAATAGLGVWTSFFCVDIQYYAKSHLTLEATTYCPLTFVSLCILFFYLLCCLCWAVLVRGPIPHRRNPTACLTVKVLFPNPGTPLGPILKDRRKIKDSYKGELIGCQRHDDISKIHDKLNNPTLHHRWYAERCHLKRNDFLETTKELQGDLKPPVEKP